MSRTYSKFQCPVCFEEMSNNGLAKTNHCRKHVREGRMIESTIEYSNWDTGLSFDVVRGMFPRYATRLGVVHYWHDGRPLCGKNLSGPKLNVYYYGKKKLCQRCNNAWVKFEGAK